MSETALALYEKAPNVQAQRTEARLSWTGVRDAWADTMGAEAGWTFELLQNVHDGGPRANKELVNVAVRWDGAAVRFEQEGTRFGLQEVAALLSGGSSKEFESDDTTGRFGNGFMVTEALACLIGITITINAAGQLELANVSLDRHGDEEAILANIKKSNEAIKSAVPIGIIENVPTAQLRYRVDRPAAVTEGLRNLRRTLSYLFATCPKLGDVVVEDLERHETWRATPSVLEREAGPHISVCNVITLAIDGTVLANAEVFSCRPSAESRAELMVLVTGASEPQVRVPEEGFPRLFARFPVRDTGILPMHLILDAPFDQPHERNQALLTASCTRLIVKATH